MSSTNEIKHKNTIETYLAINLILVIPRTRRLKGQ